MVIDSLEFARRHGRLSGRLQLGTLSRLSEVLFDVSGSLDYEVSGEAAGGNAFLTLKLEGPLRLTCQRCMDALEFSFNMRSRLRLVETDSPWPDDGQIGGLEDEACDAIEASQELDLTPLLEEEILLALPVSPRHEHCVQPAASASKEISPFAQLARLKHN